MTTSSGIRVRILGDDSDLQNKLRSSAKAVAKWGAAATAAAAAGGVALTRAGLENVDAQAKLARQLGGTIAGLRALEGAAGDAGVSSDVMSRAMERLNARIGEAQRGTGAAAESFERLGLDAQELAGMDVDERIATIADRMRDMGLSTQQAGDELRQMGIRQGEIINLMTQGGDAIRAEAEVVNDLGLALSEVDAAKVEAANDAMGVFSDLTTGVTDKLAVQFAPIIDAVSTALEDAAREAGGLGSVAERAFDIVIKGAGFGADAIRGIQVVVKGIEAAFWGMATVSSTVFRKITEGWDNAANAIGEGINKLIRGMNNLPGVNVEELELGASKATEFFTEMNETASRNMRETAGELHELLMEPLPSEGLENWVDKVKEASERAAREAVEVRGGLSIPTLPGREGEEDGEDDGQDETDELREKMQDRLSVIEQGLMSRREAEVAATEERMEELRQMEESGLVDQERIRRARESAEQQHQQRMTEIDRAGVEARIGLLSDGLGNMATLMQTENRRLFEIGKVAAIAQATIDGYQATISAYRVGSSIGGPIVGAAFAATAATATGVQIAKLASTSYGSGGGGSVSAPSSGGSSTVPDTQTGGQQAGQSQQQATQVNLDLQGDNFSRGAVLGLIEQMNEAIGDGAVLRVNG